MKAPSGISPIIQTNIDSPQATRGHRGLPKGRRLSFIHLAANLVEPSKYLILEFNFCLL